MKISTPKLSEEERKAKRREITRRYRARHPDANRRSNRNSWLKSKYGITLEEYEALFEKQGRRCAICDSDTSGSKRDFDLDHCHTTGRVRGILCHPCNVMLGMARDNPHTLSKAITYLN